MRELGPLLTASLRPDFALPKSYYREGFLAKANSIDELARQMNIDPQGLDPAR